MADLLPEFEQHFATVTAEITSKTCLLGTKDGAERHVFIRDIEKLVGEARELLESMELEVREAEPSLRERLNTRVKSYEVELNRLEDEYKRTKKSLPNEEASRADLFEAVSAGQSAHEEQRQRLLDDCDTLEHTSARLTQGHRIALETEQIGAQILNDLNGQRQTISRARQRLQETDTDLDRSSRVLNTMLRRVLQNRFVLYTVVALIVIVVIIAIYVMATRH
ncbi:vesicle transport through interaction with t-SNAREs 1a [Oratosquilla oratoria]|uniref:vesicle transport through interaction with t-SNAREs 1a n=1 Tax=Oratosquilla oratoria TaxID=337810 RepID=UPI003F766DD2